MLSLNFLKFNNIHSNLLVLHHKPTRSTFSSAVVTLHFGMHFSMEVLNLHLLILCVKQYFKNHSSILIRFFVSDLFQNPSEITEINMFMSYWFTYVWLCFYHISYQRRNQVKISEGAN